MARRTRPAAAVPARPRTFLVSNAGDEASTAAYLAGLGGPEHQRVVVRPTPGERDVEVLASDVLVALGKNPQILRTELRVERPGARAWDLARAWLIGLGIRDLVVDRVHLVTPEQTGSLIELAAEHANVWLVDAGIGRDDLAEVLAFLEYPVERLTWGQLPAALHSAPPVSSEPCADWPVLPTADFTTLLAACQRRLSRRDFDRVAAVFYPAAQRADAWANVYHSAGPATLTAGLTRWLRDEQLVDVPTAAQALITLRATQAALFVRGLLLRWNTAALGPGPARRLPGDLTAARASALGAFTRTDITAATVLSLHLNLGPIGFGCWRCGDVSPDGAVIEAPSEHGEHPGQRPIDAELPCTGLITVPAHARGIVAAHLAYRRGAGARDHHPFFIHPTDETQPVHPGLRAGIQRTNERININPPWMHRSPCRWGADVGVTPRSPGWLTERGLSLHLVDTPFHLRLPAPRLRTRADR
jgi:hypothetical protein